MRRRFQSKANDPSESFTRYKVRQGKATLNNVKLVYNFDFSCSGKLCKFKMFRKPKIYLIAIKFYVISSRESFRVLLYDASSLRVVEYS